MHTIMLYNDYNYFIPANGAENALCFYRCITINYRIVCPGWCVASAVRGTVRALKCLAQEHNTMSPARAQTQTARSRDKPTNH